MNILQIPGCKIPFLAKSSQDACPNGLIFVQHQPQGTCIKANFMGGERKAEVSMCLRGRGGTGGPWGLIMLWMEA